MVFSFLVLYFAFAEVGIFSWSSFILYVLYISLSIKLAYISRMAEGDWDLASGINSFEYSCF